MEKTRVPKGKKYWFLAYDSIRDKGINVLPSEEECCIVDFNRCELGNYFHTKEEAESMARKLRAVLAGADVIEMPSEEEIKEIRYDRFRKSGFTENFEPYDIFYGGFYDCIDYLSSKIVK